MIYFGPKTKEQQLEEEALAIVEAYQEAEEYLEHGFDDFDMSFLDNLDN